MQALPAGLELIDTSQARPVIRGTDIKVSQIASEVDLGGMSPAKVIEAHPHRTLVQVRAALAYYETHREQIRVDWARAAEFTQQMRRLYPSRLPLQG